MSKAKSLGREEVAIEDKAVSGCLAYAAPIILLVAGYFVKSSWGAITGAERPISDDSKVLNFVVGLVILGASLFFCLCCVLLLVGALWKTRMKFYERGITLHGHGVSGPRSQFLYGEVEGVRITEKHNMVTCPRRNNRDLLEIALDALAGAKPTPPRPTVYESTEYTFSFRLKGEAEPAEFRITLHRDGGEAEAVVERLAAEGIRAERAEAREET
jgi:hypothetical protein